MKNREKFSELNETELEEKFKHYKEELFNLRFQAVTGQLTNPSRISLVRRVILFAISPTETFNLKE